MAKILIALYRRLEDARKAVDALLENGFTHADISLAASEAQGEQVKSLISRLDPQKAARGRGTLLTVRAPDEMQDETLAVLKRFNPVDVQSSVDDPHLEQLGAHLVGDQPTNQETESDLSLEQARQNLGIENLGISTPGETGQTGFSPDEHNGTITMQDADRESRRAERGETPESSTAAGYSPDKARSGAEDHFPSVPGEAAGFDAFEPLYRQHFVTSYSHLGRSFEELRPAYAFGYGLAKDPRFEDRKWREVESSARIEWEVSHTDQPWDEFKDAVREAWEAVIGPD